MFYINDDMSIYITRGDAAVFSVMAENNGVTHLFQPGDVIRMKVTERKNCDVVVFQKEFLIENETDTVTIQLDRKDTKIGEVASKPVDYWYEIELNPFTNPQTIIGYDEDGAKILKIFPEGDDVPPDMDDEDVPLLDDELSLTSERPIQNQAVSRAIFGIIQAIDTGGDIPVAEYYEMSGATDNEDGGGGFVPAPSAGEQDYVLHGDGTWREIKQPDEPVKVQVMSEDVAGIAKVGDNLKIDAEGRLSVDTADEVEGDNTRPITAAAVFATVGNIELLLGTI